jgi:hypothetical protein
VEGHGQPHWIFFVDPSFSAQERGRLEPMLRIGRMALRD